MKKIVKRSSQPFDGLKILFADDEVIAWFRARGMGNVVARPFPGVDAGALRRPPTTMWTATKAALPAEKGVRSAGPRPGPDGARPERAKNSDSRKNAAKR